MLRRRDVYEDLPYPKQRERLPVVLSPEEVQCLIAGAKNLYHRTLLLTLYGPSTIDVRIVKHTSPKDDPSYIWSGSSPQPWAAFPKWCTTGLPAG